MTYRMVFISLAMAAVSCGADQAIKVTGGTATFDAETNYRSVSIKGKSTKMTGEVDVGTGKNGLRLSKIAARVPVASFATGMALRDAHLIKYIFTAQDGSTPDLTFTSLETECPPTANCAVTGFFAIRGVAKPMTLELKIVHDGTGFRVSGDGKVNLSDYGITPPEEFSVRMQGTVLFHLDFFGHEL